MSSISSKTLVQPAIQQIEQLLEPDFEPSEKLIHQTRVSIKRLRARIKMLRKLLGNKQYMNVLVDHAKELSRYLSTHRDMDVMSGLLDQLASEQDDQAKRDVLEKIKFRLIVAQEDIHFDRDRVMQLAAIVCEDFADANDHALTDQKVEKFIGKKIDRVFQKGDKILTDGECEPLHEWRKEVKEFLYQNELLSEERQPISKKPLDALGKTLGKVHDVCVLEESIEPLQDRTSPFLDADEYKLYGAVVFDHLDKLFELAHERHQLVMKDVNNK